MTSDPQNLAKRDNEKCESSTENKIWNVKLNNQ